MRNLQLLTLHSPVYLRRPSQIFVKDNAVAEDIVNDQAELSVLGKALYDGRESSCVRLASDNAKFWTAAPTTSAAVSGSARLSQLRTIRRYFASKTSGIPNQSFIPAQLFAFAGTWIALSLPQF